MTSKLEHVRNIRKFDISFEYSDDNSVWHRGRQELAKLQSAEDNDPELKGMLRKYSDWYWEGERQVGKPDPFEEEFPVDSYRF